MHAAGREDVDVRMLGNGRPFMLEFLDARASLVHAGVFPAAALAINSGAVGRVEVRRLSPATRDEFALLSAGAEAKRKRYVAVVWTSRALTQRELSALHNRGDIAVSQRTPVRVLHRRSLSSRAKIVHDIRTRLILPPVSGTVGEQPRGWEAQHLPPSVAAALSGGISVGPHNSEPTSSFFLLSLETSAGTYVKEFVHGDSGRTSPSIASLLRLYAADCLSLDVVELLTPDARVRS
jgi:tRNA pseudouridine synthase 10